MSALLGQTFRSLLSRLARQFALGQSLWNCASDILRECTQRTLDLCALEIFKPSRTVGPYYDSGRPRARALTPYSAHTQPGVSCNHHQLEILSVRLPKTVFTIAEQQVR